LLVAILAIVDVGFATACLFKTMFGLRDAISVERLKQSLPHPEERVLHARRSGALLRMRSAIDSQALRHDSLHLALGRVFAHGVVAVIGAIQIVVSIDMQAMRAVEQALARLRMKLPSRSSTPIGWAPRLKTWIRSLDAILAVHRVGSPTASPVAGPGTI